MTIHVQTPSVAIANGQTTSEAFIVMDFTEGSFQIPAAITGTSVTIHVSNNNTAYNALEDASGDAVDAIPISVNEACPFPAAMFNFKYAKLVFSDAQAAARTIPLLLKAVG